MKQYHGPGLIKQIPATKQWFLRKGEKAQSFMKGNVYRGVNENGGRKIPQGTIGAAYRHTNARARRNNDICVRLSIADDQVTLSPEVDSA